MSSLPSSSYTRLYTEAEVSCDRDFDLSADDLSPLYHALELAKDRYKGEKVIGVGGMKEILKVYDERTEREVALARPKDGIGAERYDAFLREAHITARLEHPNIIKLFDMGIDDEKRPFFTMEFKRGKSLRKILSSLKAGELVESFTSQKRLSIFLRICEGMGYAHSRHVLHLDLKPENIQVGTFGEVQICDWGMGEIARGESETHFSEALLDPDLYGDQLEPAVKGTPGYMAPEQSDPMARQTTKTDVFALGCLLYELSMLRPPEDLEEVPPVSPAIAAIVRKACAKNPQARYRDVEAMRQDVSRHLLGYSAGVERAGFFREMRLFYRRNKLPCLMSFFFVFLMVGTAVWFNQKLRGSYERTAEALVIAEDAFREADLARRRAEETLVLYTQEREFAGALFESRMENTLEGALFLKDFLMMKEGIGLPVIDNALAVIGKELAKNPPKKDPLWTMKAHFLFMTQQFDESESYYAIREGVQGDIRNLIPSFAPLVRADGLLPIADFKRLLNRLGEMPKSRHPLIEKMVIYDSLKRNSPEETAIVVEAVLKMSNPEWEDPVFEFQSDTLRLRISGKGLRSFYRSGARRNEKIVPVRSLLRLLPLRFLDLRGSEINDLWHLEGLDLVGLDIRNTPVTDLEAIAGMVGLRELIIEPGQFDSEQRAVLRGLVDVKELPLSIE